MSIGNYHNRISILSESKVKDGFGGYVPVDQERINTFARISDLSGNSYITERLKVGETRYRVHLMYRDELREKLSVSSVIEWNGQKYKIVGGISISTGTGMREITFDISGKWGE